MGSTLLTINNDNLDLYIELVGHKYRLLDDITEVNITFERIAHDRVTNLEIRQEEYHTIRIVDCKFDSLTVGQSQIESLQVLRSTIDNLFVNQVRAESRSEFEVVNSKFKYCGILNIRNTFIDVKGSDISDRLVIKNVQNAQLSIRKITTPSLDLNGCKLTYCIIDGLVSQFIKFERLDLKLAKMSLEEVKYDQAFVGDVIWPERSFLSRTLLFPFRKGENIFIENQTVINAKRLNENAGDYNATERFHENQRILAAVMSKGWLNKTENIFTTWLPYFISGFGRKFLRPLVLLFLIHLFWTFRLIYVQGPEFGLDFSSFLTWEGWNLYFFTLNPAHKLSYIDGCIISPSISFAMRLTGGVLIYQLLQATRKHLYKS